MTPERNWAIAPWEYKLKLPRTRSRGKNRSHLLTEGKDPSLKHRLFCGVDADARVDFNRLKTTDSSASTTCQNCLYVAEALVKRNDKKAGASTRKAAMRDAQLWVSLREPLLAIPGVMAMAVSLAGPIVVLRQDAVKAVEEVTRVLHEHRIDKFEIIPASQKIVYDAAEPATAIAS